MESAALSSKENIPDDLKQKVRDLISDGKSCAAEGELYKSLKCFKKAYNLIPSEKTMSRIKKIEEVLAENADDEEDDFGFVELDNQMVIYKDLVERLYPHQINGIKWMFNLYTQKKKGGILADDMGLGKTIQVIAYLSAMFDMRKIKHVLLVIPMSVIPNWVAEFKKWSPGVNVQCFHGPPSKRNNILQQCMVKRSVCITTYGMIVTQWQRLGQTSHGTEFVWDYIILDEGHRIKNPTKTTKRLHSIPSKHRLILTGTPVQNKVGDLWALVDWATQGSLLGTKKTFHSNYEIPIERARERDASAAQIQHGNTMAASLKKLTDPYILRRTKASLTAGDKENVCPDRNLASKLVDENQDQSTVSKQPSFPKLSTKNDLVVWVYLSEVQQQIYRDFLESDAVAELLMTKKSPLVQLTILKKICDHPRLLSNKACIELGLQRNNDSMCDDPNSSAIEDCAANRIDNISDVTLMEESGKLQFLIQLLIQLRDEGHRTLVFSMSRKMLNMVQRILLNHKFKIMRLDGKISKMSEREARVRAFQEDPSFNVFLLTTQVGGVGLTLTAADRVVIYDPSWNPATDDQAIDRIYRIGQKKRVVVYRLITCATVEEKIYRRQIFKQSVIQQSVQGDKDPYRYFTSEQLRELFVLGDVTCSNTQTQLSELHGHQRRVDEELQRHLHYLDSLKMFGTSDHDLMFSCKPDDFDYDSQMQGEHFQPRVKEAQDQMLVESGQFTGHDEANLRWGGFNDEKREKEKSPSPNIEDNEPVYPIGEISQQLKGFNIKTEPDASWGLPDIKREAGWGIPNKWKDVASSIKHEPSTSTNHIRRPTSSNDDVIVIEASPPATPAYNTPTKKDDDVTRPGSAIYVEESPEVVFSSFRPSTSNIPAEIQDSFDLYEASSSSDEGDPDEWKEAFSNSRLNLSTTSHGTPSRTKTLGTKEETSALVGKSPQKTFATAAQLTEKRLSNELEEDSFDLRVSASSSDEGDPDEWKEAFSNSRLNLSIASHHTSSHTNAADASDETDSLKKKSPWKVTEAESYSPPSRNHSFKAMEPAVNASFGDSPLVTPRNRKKRPALSSDEESNCSDDHLPPALHLLNNSPSPDHNFDDVTQGQSSRDFDDVTHDHVSSDDVSDFDDIGHASFDIIDRALYDEMDNDETRFGDIDDDVSLISEERDFDEVAFIDDDDVDDVASLEDGDRASLVDKVNDSAIPEDRRGEEFVYDDVIDDVANLEDGDEASFADKVDDSVIPKDRQGEESVYNDVIDDAARSDDDNETVIDEADYDDFFLEDLP